MKLANHVQRQVEVIGIVKEGNEIVLAIEMARPLIDR
jgi:hypothetical protein